MDLLLVLRQTEWNWWILCLSYSRRHSLENSIFSIQLKALCVFLGCWHDVIQSELGFHGTFHVSFCLVPPWCLSFLAGAWDPLPPYVSCSTGHCPLRLFCLKSLVIPSQIIFFTPSLFQHHDSHCYGWRHIERSTSPYYMEKKLIAAGQMDWGQQTEGGTSTTLG